MQPEVSRFAATLSRSQEQKLSEQLQQIRLHLSDLREAVHRNGRALSTEVATAMQSSITSANRLAAEAKEMAEILKVLLVLCAHSKWCIDSRRYQIISRPEEQLASGVRYNRPVLSLLIRWTSAAFSFTESMPEFSRWSSF